MTSAIGFVVGFALFGALTYLPLFQQVVRGLSPTESGLQLVPLMAGLLIASIASGQAITRTGRYKVFPVVGTAVATVGMLLLSRLDASTAAVEAGVYMFVFGVGLGLIMQVLILAVQNSVAYEQLGVATSSATLFRSIGGSLGTAVLGAIFTNRLASELAAGARSSGADLTGSGIDPAALKQLPAPVHDAYIGAFTDSLSTVFLIAAGVIAIAFVLAWLIEERPLRQTVETGDVADAFAAPQDTSSLQVITRSLSRAVGRERTGRFIDTVIERAGVPARPGRGVAGRPLSRRRRSPRTPSRPAARSDRLRLAEAAVHLEERGYLAGGDDPTGSPRLTDSGHGALPPARRGAVRAAPGARLRLEAGVARRRRDDRRPRRRARPGRAGSRRRLTLSASGARRLLLVAGNHVGDFAGSPARRFAVDSSVGDERERARCEVRRALS